MLHIGIERMGAFLFGILRNSFFEGGILPPFLIPQNKSRKFAVFNVYNIYTFLSGGSDEERRFGAERI